MSTGTLLRARSVSTVNLVAVLARRLPRGLDKYFRDRFEDFEDVGGVGVTCSREKDGTDVGIAG